MLTRRDLLKMGVIGAGGYMSLPHDRLYARPSSSFLSNPRSPATREFVTPLPIPTVPLQVGPFDEYTPPLYTNRPRGYELVNPGSSFYQIAMESRMVSFHPDLPLTPIWGYRDDNVPAGQWSFALGPTFTASNGVPEVFDFQSGVGLLVRFRNDIPNDPVGFGVNRFTIHFHGGHQPARADGFPENIPCFPDPLIIDPKDNIDHYDYFYPGLDPGTLDVLVNGVPGATEEQTAKPSTRWYHDHIIDFTAQNAYRGLAGFFLSFDIKRTDVDSVLSPRFAGDLPGFAQDLGDENDRDGLQLPSGVPAQAPDGTPVLSGFDIPLVFQDKLFDANGALVYNSFDHNGFLGDKFCVNGAIQPYLDVQRRKYRFRFLDGSNSRIYTFFLTDEDGRTYPMTQIATEGGLLSEPVPIGNFTIAMAERVEVVVDFADPIFNTLAKNPRPYLYFENRLAQTEGRKPDGLVSSGVKILQLRLSGPPVTTEATIGRVQLESRERPDLNGKVVLRPFAPIPAAELAAAATRTRRFEFNRSHGAWTINGQLAGNLSRALATPRVGVGEIWHLENSSGGWWHPIHIHSDFFRIIRRNGRQPPAFERDGNARKDTILLRGGDSVDVFVKFRDHLGPFVFHCHNMEHEDMAMMGRFDVTTDGKAFC